jgi:hypothetical protein
VITKRQKLAARRRIEARKAMRQAMIAFYRALAAFDRGERMLH